ncbi:PAS domain S-box-containing protein/diguanylate cyclase (GGDEF) domain-containing protein [Sporobacter termitidis DSM 10068]|uniref:PAS domain S-box-containing protein/diguanylate cyclase (GGDEF) domain-containing protein n=1 Tax=Sporobacter termitidis DSM 10068 TaxID=1123282 RepID=A0A1M5YNM4_9FIRM|nr:PAS domain S-box protein [Sporobacter termitidis]SHI13531.1 PAS domain S-box-containing protein/diguanylate cyclase (GGDEF) domain-containing protein [Sporobacter termitidis DSM 10068]
MSGRKRFDLFLIGGFSFLILLVIVLALLGASSLGKSRALFRQTHQNSFQAWIETERANADLITVHRAMKDVALSRNDEQLQSALNDVDTCDLNIRDYFSSMKVSDPGNPLLSDVMDAYNGWIPIKTWTITFAQNGQYELAAENTRVADYAQVKLIRSKMQLLIEQKRAEADKAYAQSEHMAAVYGQYLFWMTLLAVLLAVGMSVYVRSRLLQIQHTLHEEKEKLQITLNSIGDGVITTDTDRNVVGLNKVAEEFTGWKTAEAFGRPFSQVFDITNAYTGERAKDPVEEVLTTDSICLLENHTILTSRDGVRRHIADSAAPIKDENGETSGVVMIFRDVTERKLAEKLLMDSEERFRTIFEQAPIGIAVSDPATGRILEINGRFAEIIGRPRAAVMDVDWMSFTHPDDLRGDLDGAALLSAGKIPGYHMEKRYIRPDASVVWADMSVTLIKDRRSEGPVNLCMIADITELKNAERALAQSNTMLEATLQATADGIEALDLDGNFFFYNDQFRKMWDLPEDIADIDFTFAHILARLANPNAALSGIHDLMGRFPLEPFRELRLTDGRTIERYAKPILVDGQKTTGYVLSYRDISESKRRETEILYLNYHDLLTGLYNRAYFEEACSRLDCGRQLPISVIMGDINGLKLVNDAFGHKEGDKLLVEIARILSVCCRKEDILARTGGDEFCILLPQTAAADARAICKRIYSDCVKYGNKSVKDAFYLSISLGYATKTEAETTIESILAEAEGYMYKQKLLERKSMRSSLLSSIKTTMAEKNHITAEHEERLVALSKLIGEAMDLSDAQINELELLSTLHDLGKLSIDDQILNKPGDLTEDEWVEIRKHPEVGYRITQASPELAPIAEYILCHHEHWDGSGYPQGLRGEAIPLLSRIVSVVDSYDAMTQDRPYRTAMPRPDAIREILANAGTQFDPAVAQIFISVLQEFGC